MPDYILRDMDDTLWRQIKSNAALEGLTVRQVITKLLTEYAKVKIKAKGKA